MFGCGSPHILHLHTTPSWPKELLLLDSDTPTSLPPKVGFRFLKALTTLSPGIPILQMSSLVRDQAILSCLWAHMEPSSDATGLCWILCNSHWAGPGSAQFHGSPRIFLWATQPPTVTYFFRVKASSLSFFF